MSVTESTVTVDPVTNSSTSFDMDKDSLDNNILTYSKIQNNSPNCK